MIRYVFRKDEPLRIMNAEKADPQVIGEALAKITEKHGGELTPEDVVAEAASPRNPLHKHFQWDDKVAAQAHRLEQARRLIRIVRVEDVTVEEGNTRAFLSISDKGGVAYHAVQEVKRSVELQAAVLRQAERDLLAFERRYRDLAEICDIVRGAREQIERRRSKLETRATQ